VLEPVEARLMAGVGVLFLIVATLVAFFPPVLVYPLCIVFVWFGVVLLCRSYKLRRDGKRKRNLPEEQAAPRPVT
jgi:cardiolipin synthase